MPKITGIVTYTGNDTDFHGVQVTAVYKSGDKAIYIEEAYLDHFQPDTQTSSEIHYNATQIPAYDAVKVTAYSY